MGTIQKWSARKAALEILRRMEARASSPREAAEHFFHGHEDIPEQERAFARDLVNGVLQRLNTLDWALDRFAKPRMEKLDPDVRAALRLGALQILFWRERVPAYAALNETVDLLKGRGHAGRLSFVNAVLRTLERERERLPWPSPSQNEARALALKYSHPEWMVARWLDRWGAAETLKILEANNAPAPLCLRVNTLRITREGLADVLLLDGMNVSLSSVSVDGMRVTGMSALTELKAYREGYFMVQDEASQLAAQALAPEPGETVLDLCAAPGGKTTHLVQLMNDRGRVVALDISREKLKLVNANVTRLGLRNVEMKDMAARWAGKHFEGQADRVLVDAPCSSLGIIRRRPDVRWNKTEEQVTKVLPIQQREALEGAAKCLRPGGVLVYSTCTFEPEETSEMVNSFLKKHPDFSRDALPFTTENVLSDAITDEGDLLLLPHRHGTDGFFIARLKKG